MNGRPANAFGRALGWIRSLGTGRSAHQEPPPADDLGWNEIRVVADADTHDRLLADVVRPFVAEPSHERRRLFFLRDRQDATRTLRIWVNGATTEAVAALARALSGGDAAATAPRVVVRYGFPSDIVSGKYGGEQASALLVQMLVEAAPLVLDQLAAIVSGRADRITTALDIMVAHLPAIDIARVYPGRYDFAQSDLAYPGSYPVYRSHADGFFVMSTDSAGARAQFDRLYDDASASIRPRVAAILAQCDGGSICSDVAARWFATARTYLERCEAAVRGRTLSVFWSEGSIGDTHDLSVSIFHQIVQGARALRLFFRRDSGYLAARTTMSGLYLVLGSLGISLTDRVFLCNAICRSFEELYAVDTTAVVRNLAKAVPRRARRPAAFSD